MLVEFSEKVIRDTAIANAKNLKNRVGCDKVYIGEDHTVAERAARKQAVERCKEMNRKLGEDTTFVNKVRGFEVVQVDKRTKKIVKVDRSSLN